MGNGASMAIHPSFRYSSLLKVAKKRSSPNHLRSVDVALFEEFRTEDFEVILRTLDRSKRVNEILGLRTVEHVKRYEAVQKALVGAIGRVHPEFDQLEEPQLKAASFFLSRFERVFTSNYDLLLYWMLMYRRDWFGDYFWTPSGAFNQSDTELWNGTAVIYLHGALFLFSTEAGAVKKITSRQGTDLLTMIRKKLGRGAVPVFVSEGTSKQKRAAIRRHDYLRFAFRTLRTSNKNLVIFGHSLSRRDNHVVEAISRSERENIAYSVHRNGRSASQLEALRREIAGKFPGKRVLFFDSNSFPIYRGDRNIPRRSLTDEEQRRKQ